MSIKNLYLPAQSGKIRMENGVYCGLKGVKSMIEVIYKEETDTTITVNLKVAADDMGKVIGKQGRIAKSIRTVVKAAASKIDKKVDVEILQ